MLLRFTLPKSTTIHDAGPSFLRTDPKRVIRLSCVFMGLRGCDAFHSHQRRRSRRCFERKVRKPHKLFNQLHFANCIISSQILRIPSSPKACNLRISGHPQDPPHHQGRQQSATTSPDFPSHQGLLDWLGDILLVPSQGEWKGEIGACEQPQVLIQIDDKLLTCFLVRPTKTSPSNFSHPRSPSRPPSS